MEGSVFLLVRRSSLRFWNKAVFSWSSWWFFSFNKQCSHSCFPIRTSVYFFSMCTKSGTNQSREAALIWVGGGKKSEQYMTDNSVFSKTVTWSFFSSHITLPALIP